MALLAPGQDAQVRNGGSKIPSPYMGLSLRERLRPIKLLAAVSSETWENPRFSSLWDARAAGSRLDAVAIAAGSGTKHIVDHILSPLTASIQNAISICTRSSVFVDRPTVRESYIFGHWQRQETHHGLGTSCATWLSSAGFDVIAVVRLCNLARAQVFLYFERITDVVTKRLCLIRQVGARYFS